MATSKAILKSVHLHSNASPAPPQKNNNNNNSETNKNPTTPKKQHQKTHRHTQNHKSLVKMHKSHYNYTVRKFWSSFQHINKGSNITDYVTIWNIHTHIVQMDRGEGQCCLIKIFGEESIFEFVFEGRYSSRVPEVLGETVPDMGTEA